MTTTHKTFAPLTSSRVGADQQVGAALAERPPAQSLDAWGWMEIAMYTLRPDQVAREYEGQV